MLCRAGCLDFLVFGFGGGLLGYRFGSRDTRMIPHVGSLNVLKPLSPCWLLLPGCLYLQCSLSASRMQWGLLGMPKVVKLQSSPVCVSFGMAAVA